ncbi:hypothetical protein J2Z22_002829 [Paenibacillus forsythiae]|uniref:DUF2812 domain-containing protein n=1 Tax=Paenibacillus forsythiae TaxID=365616 RepID=A0ABU3H8Y1_9BACL|nr:DUF2812 domain-containing protein [Paenibacillus forsythiae]MDT3427278.1 hypothetical protein [Paenibacillus forsythiae]
MKKTVFKVFFSALEGQERWLNQMASEGWRLLNVNQFFYTFERSMDKKFVYRVEFVGNKSRRELEDYKNFLKQNNIATFSKGINIGKFSYGSIKWRPYGNKGGKFATSPGTINSELLILEKEEEDDNFEIYTDEKSKINYYTTIRSAYILASILLTLTFLISSPSPLMLVTQYSAYKTLDFRIIFKIVNFLFLFPLFYSIYRYTIKISELQE